MAEAVSKPQRGVVTGMMRMAAIGLFALVAGCAGGRIIPQPERPPAAVAPPPGAAPVIQPGLPEDEARHRVALLVPLTGQNAGVGQSIANATQMALLDTNNDRVRITTYDTAAGADGAVRAALAEGNGLILGPLLADDVRVVAPVARAAHVPVLSFSNDSSVAGQGTYLLGYSPAQSIARVVAYARASGVTDFAGLVANGVYGERAGSALVQAVGAAGGRVVAMESFDNRPGSLTTAVTRMGRTPFQAVLIAASGDSAAAAAPLLRRTTGGATAHILGTELWNADSGIGGNRALDGAWFASVPNNYYRQYARRYRERFGVAPYRLSTLGYDAVLLVVRLADDWRVGRTFPEARLRDPGGFAGLDGAFRFGADGIAERALEVQEIRGGTTTVVAPAPTGF